MAKICLICGGPPETPRHSYCQECRPLYEMRRRRAGSARFAAWRAAHPEYNPEEHRTGRGWSPFGPAARRTTAERGLGGEHQATRRRLLPTAYGKPCPICGHLMTQDQPLDLDHIIPRALGGTGGPVQVAHSSCNRRSGALLGQTIRFGGRKKVPQRW